METGNEREFLTQLAAQMELRLQDHVRAADSLAILGPNHLELSYSPSYDFSRRLCEKPENLGLIERVARRITGMDVRFTIRSIAPELQTAGNTSRQPTTADPEVRKVNLDEADRQPFVGQLSTVFGAKVVSVQSVPSAGPSPAHLPRPEDSETDAESDSST